MLQSVFIYTAVSVSELGRIGICATAGWAGPGPSLMASCICSHDTLNLARSTGRATRDPKFPSPLRPMLNPKHCC